MTHTILAIETSMGLSSAAVWSGRLLAERTGGPAREQSEALLPLIRAVMDEAGVAIADLTRVAVTTGPGTFTGVRASLAAAKGFALALGVETVGVGSLEVMAHNFAREARGGSFIIVAPAGRDGVYAQTFDERGAPQSEAVVTSLDAVAASGLLLAGPGAVNITDAAAPNLAPTAPALAEMAATRAPTPILAPLYLRPADARPQMSKVLARAT